jgi:hypothetical protein
LIGERVLDLSPHGFVGVGRMRSAGWVVVMVVMVMRGRLRDLSLCCRCYDGDRGYARLDRRLRRVSVRALAFAPLRAPETMSL